MAEQVVAGTVGEAGGVLGEVVEARGVGGQGGEVVEARGAGGRGA